MRDLDVLYESVTKNEKGYYELKQEYRKEMLDYYKDVYFQEDNGLYCQQYDELDLKHKENYYALKLHIVSMIQEGYKKDPEFLDVGAGEGFALAYFSNSGWNVTGIDLSSYGVRRHNPEMKKYLKQGDFFSIVEELNSEGIVYDFINADNVLEHLPDPMEFFEKIRKVSKRSTIICITVPNDYSIIQKMAFDMGQIDYPFWVTKDTSEHFNYFSKESLSKLASDAGFETKFAISDWPIDFFLLNTYSNYRNAPIGHECHVACAKLENAIYGDSLEKATNLFRALADVGIGRQISLFLCQP